MKPGYKLFHRQGFVPGEIQEVSKIQIKPFRSINRVELVEVI